MNTLAAVFSMGKYSAYVYLSYGAVLVFLAWQWFLPWRRWRKFHQNRNRTNE